MLDKKSLTYLNVQKQGKQDPYHRTCSTETYKKQKD